MFLKDVRLYLNKKLIKVHNSSCWTVNFKAAIVYNFQVSLQAVMKG